MEYVSSIERIKLEQTRQEGRQEGLQEGESVMLCRLLTRRFGELPQWVQERIKSASEPEIALWFDRGVDARTLIDVFQGLGH